MTFKPAVWRPIAVVLSLVNLGGLWFAASATEPLHAVVHGGLALVFGVWAERLGRSTGQSELQPAMEQVELEVDQLRQQLSEAQDRIDFAERMLTQDRDRYHLDSR